MTVVNETVKSTVATVTANGYAVELPPKPIFPAAVWRIDTEQEEQWCMDGGYDQHLVTVFIISRTMGAIDALKPLFRAAFEALAEFMFEEGGADAPFEDDPNLFAYAMTFRLRTRR